MSSQPILETRQNRGRGSGKAEINNQPQVDPLCYPALPLPTRASSARFFLYKMLIQVFVARSCDKSRDNVPSLLNRCLSALPFGCF